MGGEIFLDIRITELEELHAVGLSWSGTYSQLDQLTNLFTFMEERKNEIGKTKNQNIFVAPFHNRETEMTYYVTIPVEKIETIPEGMVGFTIPAKSYVFGTHIGTAAEIENTYKEIFSWMDDYGYDLDRNALSLEVYKTGSKKDYSSDEQIQFEIYLPVEKYKKKY